MSEGILKNIESWFIAATPQPTEHGQHVQLGVHFEEVAEMLDCIVGSNDEADKVIVQAHEAVHNLAIMLKQGRINVYVQNRVDLVDALADQIVTAVGVGHQFRVDVDGATHEANRANFSKFDVEGHPVFDAYGKITKGPNYVRPNMEPFVK